jgi:hypothetical protein
LLNLRVLIKEILIKNNAINFNTGGKKIKFGKGNMIHKRVGPEKRDIKVKSRTGKTRILSVSQIVLKEYPPEKLTKLANTNRVE